MIICDILCLLLSILTKGQPIVQYSVGYRNQLSIRFADKYIWSTECLFETVISGSGFNLDLIEVKIRALSI